MSLFNRQSHKIPTSYIREYPRSTADSQEDELLLAVKQYTPLDNRSPKEGDVTIIGAHANGFPKELYEPLWDELHGQLRLKGVNIRNIWIADVAHQGESGVLNEHKLGNDPSWSDHPRDLFLMINHFRHQIRRPLIGLGHSMGGCHLVNLSLMHPRLFTSLILIDPVIQRLPNRKGNFGPAKASTVRRDCWPSRQAARAAFERSKFYKTWDNRVLDLWIKHGIRELPTALYLSATPASSTLPALNPDPTSATVHPAPDTEREVTLTTTKDQEVLTFMRSNFNDPASHPNPVTHPDIPVQSPPNTPFYRPEPINTFMQLPHLRPSVLYIFGSLSDLSAPVLQADKLASTGTGVGGSGGVKEGRVKGTTFDGVGHLIPMEVVDKTAGECAEWMGSELQRWQALEVEEEREWAKVPRERRNRMSDEFVEVMKSDWMNGDEKGGKAKL